MSSENRLWCLRRLEELIEIAPGDCDLLHLAHFDERLTRDIELFNQVIGIDAFRSHSGSGTCLWTI